MIVGTFLQVAAGGGNREKRSFVCCLDRRQSRLGRWRWRGQEGLGVIFAEANAHAEGVSLVNIVSEMSKLEGRDLDVEIARYWNGPAGEVERERRRSAIVVKH